MAKQIRYTPRTQYHLPMGDDKIASLEKLVDDIQQLRFDKTMSVILGEDYVITLYKRQTSSPAARRKAYAYTGDIHFLYGPDRKYVTVYLQNKNDRSYKHFIESNMRYILQRAVQHFELKTEQLHVSEKLACWLK